MESFGALCSASQPRHGYDAGGDHARLAALRRLLAPALGRSQIGGGGDADQNSAVWIIWSCNEPRLSTSVSSRERRSRPAYQNSMWKYSCQKVCIWTDFGNCLPARLT